MLLGVIADDFTGASDIAVALSKGLESEGGLRTVQYLGIPQDDAGADVEAGVIALKSRSVPAADAIALSLDALAWLLSQGCRQVVFKYCSTFDSIPEGNIGQVAEALAARLGVSGVVACPAFPAAGRRLYQGHLFVGDRLLNESGMEAHPLTPMTDPDVKRWLTRQCRRPVGLVDWHRVRQGAQTVRGDLAKAAQDGVCLVIADALTDEDLLILAAACAEAPLLTGSSGIALGLPHNFIASGRARGSRPDVPSVSGPEAILVGSCSRTTLAQIDFHAKQHPVLAIDATAVMEDRFSSVDIVTFVRDHTGRAPLVHSSADESAVERLQKRHGRAVVANRLERLFAEAASALVDSGVRRIVVGGGETSGAVVSALGLRSFRIGPEIDPGVPILVSDTDPGLALALKSGNFGGRDFFFRAVEAMAGLPRAA